MVKRSLWLIYLIHLNHIKPSNKNSAIIILTLDAEKAFDRVEWPFLFTSLNHFGIGPAFINWIKILYNSPASVRTNGHIAQSFTLQRGTRQACPLSPLLFALL